MDDQRKADEKSAFNEIKAKPKVFFAKNHNVSLLSIERLINEKNTLQSGIVDMVKILQKQHRSSFSNPDMIHLNSVDHLASLIS